MMFYSDLTKAKCLFIARILHLLQSIKYNETGNNEIHKPAFERSYADTYADIFNVFESDDAGLHKKKFDFL